MNLNPKIYIVFFFRDDILSLVYKARNHWVTHCNCDKKLFVNSIQDILR